VAPGGVLSLTSNLPLSIYCCVDYASGAPGLGLAKIFFLLRLNRRRTTYLRAGLPMFRLTYVPAYQRSGLPTRHQLFNLPGFRPSPVQAEHLSFSFYVIGFFFVYKIIFLFFLLSMQLKHVIVTLLT
jgi:hypothetical protein